MSLPPLRGAAVFGPAYRIMMENDIHAPGSIDRILVENMVLICPETVSDLYGSFTPTTVTCQRGRLAELERISGEATGKAQTPGERVASIIKFCKRLRERFEASETEPDAWKSMRFGGTEEAIIERATDWCADLARVACALCQVQGIPARIVYLADVTRAYSGHVIIEAFIDGTWGAADALHGLLYRNSDGKPASTRDLMRNPQLVAAAGGDAGQFRMAAISNYCVWERNKHDYPESTLDENPYYMTILEMSNRGWPDGLRWLHGEDGSAPEQPPRRL